MDFSQLNYYQMDTILSDCSEDSHPNIEKGTLHRWRKEKRDMLREHLRSQIGQLTEASRQRELTGKEAADLTKAQKLLRERVVEKESVTCLATPPKPEHRACEQTTPEPESTTIYLITPPPHIEGMLESVAELLATADQVPEYIAYFHDMQEPELTRTLSHDTEAMAYLEEVLIINSQKNNKTSALRIARFITVFSMFISAPGNRVPRCLHPKTVFLIERQSEEYLAKVWSHLHTPQA
ncbi:hypothetical protein NEDG_00054 [Nematocida displodere]|uniref:Uncharacterized protein n=1 Tax=Nematocida displodere TaxID=1805483 RepID=A0A177EKS0_9MICR|nr:hypothetical protein NEDG_00054 [Nematocida displodere]